METNDTETQFYMDNLESVNYPSLFIPLSVVHCQSPVTTWIAARLISSRLTSLLLP